MYHQKFESEKELENFILRRYGKWPDVTYDNQAKFPSIAVMEWAEDDRCYETLNIVFITKEDFN